MSATCSISASSAYRFSVIDGGVYFSNDRLLIVRRILLTLLAAHAPILEVQHLATNGRTRLA